jgi:nucleotide-binding universal stress UspA family protein
MSDVIANRPEDWDDPVALPPITAPSKVLVPFDGSHTAERALAWAELVSRTGGAEVIVVVAYEPPLTVRGRGADYVEAARDALSAEAHAIASEAVQLLVEHGVRARGVVAKGEPVGAILDVAEHEHVGIIILGRQGLSSEVRGITHIMNRFKDSLRGGVAEQVSRHAGVPVVLVP